MMNHQHWVKAGELRAEKSDVLVSAELFVPQRYSHRHCDWEKPIQQRVNPAAKEEGTTGRNSIAHIRTQKNRNRGETRCEKNSLFNKAPYIKAK